MPDIEPEGRPVRMVFEQGEIMKVKNSVMAVAISLQFLHCATPLGTHSKDDVLFLTDKTERINAAFLHCQRFERKQNIWTGIGIGASALSGSAGLGVIPAAESDNPTVKWSFAGVSVVAGLLAALSAGMTKIHSNSFRDHKCSEIYTRRADVVLSGFAVPPVPPSATPTPAPSGAVTTSQPAP